MYIYTYVRITLMTESCRCNLDIELDRIYHSRWLMRGHSRGGLITIKRCFSNDQVFHCQGDKRRLKRARPPMKSCQGQLPVSLIKIHCRHRFLLRNKQTLIEKHAILFLSSCLCVCMWNFIFSHKNSFANSI